MAIVFDQIGSEFFIRLDGDLSPEANTIEEITRGAVDGRAFRQQGQRGNFRELRGLTDVTTNLLASAKLSTYRAMVGTLVSIVLAADTFTNYLIVDADGVSRQAGATAVGGINAGDWLVESVWTVVYGGT